MVSQTACRFCPSNAVTSGVCGTCGKPQNPKPPRTKRRRTCMHRSWTKGPVTYIGGGYSRTDTCNSCSKTRRVEP